MGWKGITIGDKVTEIFLETAFAAGKLALISDGREEFWLDEDGNEYLASDDPDEDGTFVSNTWGEPSLA